MRDYLGLFLVIAGLLGVVLWVNSTSQKSTEFTPVPSPRPSGIVAAPPAERAFTLHPHSSVKFSKKALVKPPPKELSAGIFDENEQRKAEAKALGIPVLPYLKDQKSRFPHANVFADQKDGLRVFVQCWEIKDPNPAILPPKDCEGLLARKQRSDVSGVRFY